MDPAGKGPGGMAGFTLIWVGQLLSLVGSSLTWFALSIWAWQETGLATSLALVSVCSFGSTLLLSPLAGALVDRWDRKRVMMLSDLATGLATIVVLLLYLTGKLQIWHLYGVGAFAGAFQAFHWPAYSAAITTMVSKAQYGRANGMMGMIDAASLILAPPLAGALIPLVGIGGILAIDIATFVVALLLLLIVQIPRPRRTEEGLAGRGSLWQECTYGFRYILARPSLLGLQMVFLGTNIVGAVPNSLITPMILARTDNDAQLLGLVFSCAGAGGLLGGLLMSTWGGPKRRVHGVLGPIILSGPALVMLGLGRALPLWAAGNFLYLFFSPIVNGSNQALWQSKVAPDVQGRVFAARRMLAQASFPLSVMVVAPLADFFFEPAMQPGGWAAARFDSLLGHGPGAGMSLMLLLAGFMLSLVGLAGYLFPAVHHAEEILPDHLSVEEREVTTVEGTLQAGEALQGNEAIPGGSMV